MKKRGVNKLGVQMLHFKYRRALLQIVLCGLGSMAVGYLVFGNHIFNRELTLFEFVAAGWIAGVFVAANFSVRQRWTPLVVGDRVFPGLAVGKFVVWSALFAMAYTGAILLVGQVLSIPVDTEITLQGARMGAMQGAGIGLGYELSTLIGARIWNTQAELPR